MHHPSRRIRAIFAIAVTLLLLALALLHVQVTDFNGFTRAPFLSATPLVLVLLLLTTALATHHKHHLHIRMSSPFKNGRPLHPGKITKEAKWSRVVPCVIAGLLALLGLLVLSHQQGGAPFRLTVPVWQFGTAIPLAAALSLWWGRKFYTDRLRSIAGVRQALKQFPRTAFYVATSQVITIICLSLCLRAYGADVDFTILLAGASVVCFAASIPIGVNGWGLREVAALYIFGIVGVSPGIAVFASLTLGLGLALASFLIPALFQATPRETIEDKTEPDPCPHPDGTRADPFSIGVARNTRTASLVLGFGLLAAILLFFQFQITLGGSTITLNLADPIALGFLAMGILFLAFRVNAMIRLPRLAWCWLAGMTIILGLIFLIGVQEFGVTSWALTNRLAGWVVLMGYAACGAAIITLFGAVGRKRLVETFLAATLSVIVVHMGARFGYATGLLDTQPPFNFEGYAANRNSFAFQTLIVLGLSIAVLKPNRQLPSALLTTAITMLLFAILQSGSLTGIFTAAILLLILGFHFCYHRRRLLIAAIVALVLWKAGNALATEAVEYILSIWSPAEPRDRRFHAITQLIFIESSIAARLQSIQAALHTFLDHPVFGAGLGWGLHSITSAQGDKILIHSTFMWILAEAGLVGFIGAFWYPCLVLVPKIRTLLSPYSNPARNTPIKAAIGLWAFVLVIVFGLFSITHEIGYQRLLWLMIGAACAIPLGSRRADRDQKISDTSMRPVKT
ncbi:MAG TPA: hypothetical protein DCL95_19100 [Rhodospirillaceae bacterium]|nr:hypothetical protein [Rhodospirillaceae bacterium]MAX63459.1 hypothetical protein [Rhodospirillaceae bacterium]MBB56472.1 hypothetical protein [Rhodospirillaceae bacterium]HAJ22133.1 hypothetical protein [Rhodospirillaceae bacterium]